MAAADRPWPRGDGMRTTGATTHIVGNPWKNWLFVRLEADQDAVPSGDGQDRR